MTNLNEIPKDLKALPQWVCYRTKKLDDKTAKFMISPKDGTFAKSNDPSTWMDFESAKKYMMKRRLDGLAFVLTNNLVFIDIDHSVIDGAFSNLTKLLLDEFPNTYAEISCSGKGVHIITKGNLPQGAMKRNDKIGLEMYDTKRFVCITGNVIGDRKSILDYSNKIADVNYSYIGKKERKLPSSYKTEITFQDEELINKIQRSKNGYKFSSLYSGDITGYPSWSNADYALARILAFWTQDINQIDRLFRSSGLYRDKWDKRIGDSTYGEITISNAIRDNVKVYQREIEM